MQVADTIKTIIAKQLNRSPDEISEDSDLETLGVESIDILEIVFEVETRFNIHVPYNSNNPEDMKLRNVGDLVQLVESAINAR